MKNDIWYAHNLVLERGFPDKVIRGYNGYGAYAVPTKNDAQRAWAYGAWVDAYDLLTHYSDYEDVNPTR